MFVVFIFVVGVFLFFFGCLVDMFGGYYVFNVGFIWFFFWIMVVGFLKNLVMLIVCWVMEGLGLVVFLLVGIFLFGCIYCFGLRKNFIFGFYGVIGLIGFFVGIMVVGVV